MTSVWNLWEFALPASAEVTQDVVSSQRLWNVAWRLISQGTICEHPLIRR
jgi:hypothetical protein